MKGTKALIYWVLLSDNPVFVYLGLLIVNAYCGFFCPMFSHDRLTRVGGSASATENSVFFLPITLRCRSDCSNGIPEISLLVRLPDIPDLGFEKKRCHYSDLYGIFYENGDTSRLFFYYCDLIYL